MHVFNTSTYIYVVIFWFGMCGQMKYHLNGNFMVKSMRVWFFSKELLKCFGFYMMMLGRFASTSIGEYCMPNYKHLSTLQHWGYCNGCTSFTNLQYRRYKVNVLSCDIPIGLKAFMYLKKISNPREEGGYSWGILMRIRSHPPPLLSWYCIMGNTL